jgi:hypothetical protein
MFVQWVSTAAHCVVNRTGIARPPSNFKGTRALQFNTNISANICTFYYKLIEGSNVRKYKSHCTVIQTMCILYIKVMAGVHV